MMWSSLIKRKNIYIICWLVVVWMIHLHDVTCYCFLIQFVVPQYVLSSISCWMVIAWRQPIKKKHEDYFCYLISNREIRICCCGKYWSLGNIDPFFVNCRSWQSPRKWFQVSYLEVYTVWAVKWTCCSLSVTKPNCKLHAFSDQTNLTSLSTFFNM